MRRRILFNRIKKVISELAFWSDTLTADTLTDKSGEDNTCAITQSNCLYFDGTGSISYDVGVAIADYISSFEVNYSYDNVTWNVHTESDNEDLNIFAVVDGVVLVGNGYTGYISKHFVKDISGTSIIECSVAEGVGGVSINRAGEYNSLLFPSGLVDSDILVNSNKFV